MLRTPRVRSLAVTAVAALALAGLPLAGAAAAEGDPVTTSLAGASADGLAFDVDENGFGDITVSAKDQSGAEISMAFRTLTYHWVVRPFAGGEPITTDEQTTLTGVNSTMVKFPGGQPAGTYELYAALSAAPFTGEGAIAEAKVLTIKAGEADVTWRLKGPQQALAGDFARVDGVLALEDGTGLEGRPLDLSWTRGAETEPDGDGDAGLVDGDQLVTGLRVTTGAGGAISATVADVKETPQPAELGGTLDAASPFALGGGVGAEADPQGVDFLKTLAVGSVTIAAETPLSVDGKTPGRPVSSSVTVKSPTGNPLANQKVRLTTDKGFFTTHATTMAGLTPAATPTAGSDAGAWKNLGASIEATTDGDGVARFTLAIERDAGFDDDGRVDATVTASATGPGTTTAVTDTEVVDWTTANPFNGGKVRLEPAPAALQQSGVLPKAPLSDTVVLDVVAEDQFGNPVAGETVTLADDATGAEIDVASVKTDLVADGDVTLSATAAAAQKVTGTWSTETHRWASATAQAPAGSENVTGDYTAEWYAVDPAASSFSLVSDGEGSEVGQAVTSTYTATDQHGEPIADLFVEFFRAGPGSQGGGEAAKSELTGQDGLVDYVFVASEPGEVRISTVGRSGSAAGSPVAQAAKSVSFDYGTVVVCRCSPIAAVLKGPNNGPKADRLRVITKNAAVAGAKVRLFKYVDGKRKLVRTGTLNGAGNWKTKVKDTNGKKRTRYVAVISKTESTTGARTNFRLVR
ncbi:Ig-like domain-containing protein [Nocardioides ferulae]|uniref:Ig-like domain-containing protein n=1 Tax=Nocardioides ferulae TaxID=2340821 RepID=UPI000EB02801|nr:Ig-like domain-containing protein [Nocardioides ferulae]